MTHSADILGAPCKFCEYNGPGYYQKFTHHPACPWRRIGGREEREELMNKLLPMILGLYFERRKRRARP